MLAAIKLMNTVIWAILAGSTVVLPLAGVLRRFRWAAILTGLVLVECGVPAVNRSRCQLSDLAQQFTTDRADNFNIYLPNWLAGRNKVIFGLLFIRRVGRARMLGKCSTCLLVEISCQTAESITAIMFRRHALGLIPALCRRICLRCLGNGSPPQILHFVCQGEFGEHVISSYARL